jgi:putative endonuclease
MSNNSRTLCIGVTSDITRRVLEHKAGNIPGFTKKYKIDRLVYFENCANVNSAILREKELKSWLRKKKIELIETVNPLWNDLFMNT